MTKARCPRCFEWHEGSIPGCTPPDEIDDSMLNPAPPSYVTAAIEFVKAEKARQKVEEAAKLVKEDEE